MNPIAGHNMSYPSLAVTSRQMQRLDEKAIKGVGIPSLVLMENAGRLVAGEVRRMIPRKSRPTVTVVCGNGNNAGDGLVAARHLLEKSIKTHVVLIGKSGGLKNDAKVNYQILKKLKYPVIQAGRVTPRVSRMFREADIIVDAVFGFGLNRKIEAPFDKFIGEINASKARIVAVDIPSGLDGTTGKIWGVCVRAQRTVTFSLPKKGFYLKDGPGVTGKVVVVDIGIPKKLMKM